MSLWVAKQRQEGFLLYRKYLAMMLHFKEGTDYDYALYGGNTNVTQAAFNKKPPTEVMKFINLNNKLKNNDIRVDHFLLSNARKDEININQLLDREAFWNYENWNIKFGTKDSYEATVRSILIETEASKRGTTLAEISLYLLTNYACRQADDHLESVAWILQRAPDCLEELTHLAEENVFKQLALQRVIKLKRIYGYLELI